MSDNDTDLSFVSNRRPKRDAQARAGNPGIHVHKLWVPQCITTLRHPFCQVNEREAGSVKKPRRPLPKTAPIRIPVPKQQSTVRGVIQFPDIADARVSGSGQPWAWPKKFIQSLKANGYKFQPRRKIQMFTEFTGSACAESTALCLAQHMDVELELVSAGDIDNQCRRMIQNNRA